MLSFIPEFFSHVLLLLGLLFASLSIISCWTVHERLVETCLIVLASISFVGSGYLYGSNKVRAAQKDQIAIAEEKVKTTEAAASAVTTQVVTKYKTIVKTITEREPAIKEYILVEVAKHDTECEIPAEFITAVNAAASGVSP